MALLLTLIGLALVLFIYPRRDKEEAYYATVMARDAAGGPPA